MLKTRAITAVVLLAVLLSSLAAPSPWFFSAVVMLLMAAAGWEWAKLQACSAFVSIAFAGLLGLSMLGVQQHVLGHFDLRGLWLVISAAWVFGSVWALRMGASSWLGLPAFVRLVIGYVALLAAWMAVEQAKGIGMNFLVSAMALVWMADIGAYFAGRTFGGKWFVKKLAPSISPGKTWEGVVGGLFGVLCLSWLWCTLDAQLAVSPLSFYSGLQAKGWGLFFIALFFLTAMSVVGDLMESLMKRAAHVKDSSRLLPGHGGVLDRIDALLPVLPIVMWLHTV